MKRSVPLKFGSGVYRTAPVSVSTAVPCTGSDTPATVRVSPSGSLSLVRTAMVTGVSSAVCAASSTASGGSSTGRTVTSTAACAVSPDPSPTT